MYCTYHSFQQCRWIDWLIVGCWTSSKKNINSWWKRLKFKTYGMGINDIRHTHDVNVNRLRTTIQGAMLHRSQLQIIFFWERKRNCV